MHKMARIKRFCCDNETGEVITYQVNDETGEPTVSYKLPNIHLVDRLSNTQDFLAFPRERVSKNKKFEDLKEKIRTGANTTSPRMLLLIPTLMIFSGLICVVLMSLEIFLHIRCHKKNKNLKNTNIYYRSPFHVITSTFCGWCRECDMASKIGQIQDKRRYKYDYLRGAL